MNWLIVPLPSCKNPMVDRVAEKSKEVINRIILRGGATHRSNIEERWEYVWSAKMRTIVPSTGSDGSSATNRVPIYLNVYDLTPMNGYVYWVGLGIFHSGIEVHGLEYAFGAHDFPTSGVFEVEPRNCPGFTFRRSILVGSTDLSRQDFRRFIETVADEYNGNSYHLIAKNCNHFTNDVCYRLTGKYIPGWVNRLAGIGSFCNCLLPESLQVPPDGLSVDDYEGSEQELKRSLTSLAERADDSPTSKDGVESERDQDEQLLLRTPNGDTQALIRDRMSDVS